MTKKIISSFLTIIFLCLANSCSSKKIQYEPLEFHNENQTIMLEILNQDKSLKINKSSRVKVSLKNIDKKSLMVSGQGVSPDNSIEDEHTLIFNIEPPRTSIKDNKFELMIAYKIDEKIIAHKFLLPIM